MTQLPLEGVPLAVSNWPAARVAGRLLAALGAEVSVRPGVALASGTSLVDAAPSTAEQDWQASGAAELTGRPTGPPLLPVGLPATVARAAGLALELLSGHRVDTVERLGQRAPLLGLQRQGAISAGGAARLLPAADGWFAMNLPRPSDIELVPALVESAVSSDPWSDITRWSAGRTAAEVVERASILGLAAAALTLPDPSNGEHPPCAPWMIRPCGEGVGSSTPLPAKLRVVNLGSLWAAPLCAHLLHDTGMEVVDVEATARPDASPPDFYRLLHQGHQRLQLDLNSAGGRDELRDLLRTADVVVEASRPRALRNLGVSAEAIMSERRKQVWVRITGYGQHSNRVAFGDDAAVGGGLIASDADGPVFAGDAIADPLTGILAALAVTACVRSKLSWLIDIAMRDVATYAAMSD
ncbi:CoA transferase [Jatrophihabitans sp. DSM 45814]